MTFIVADLNLKTFSAVPGRRGSATTMRKTTEVSTRCPSDHWLFRRSWCTMLARDRVPAVSFPVNLLLQIADVRVDPHQRQRWSRVSRSSRSCA
jgi:hypothetical protein